MARRSFLRVAGVIENMSAFTCEHGTAYALFGTGGGQALADEVGVALLGQVPIEAGVAAGGDSGEPVALAGTGRRPTPSAPSPGQDRHRDRAARQPWTAARPSCCAPSSCALGPAKKPA